MSTLKQYHRVLAWSSNDARPFNHRALGHAHYPTLALCKKSCQWGMGHGGDGLALRGGPRAHTYYRLTNRIDDPSLRSTLR